MGAARYHPEPQVEFLMKTIAIELYIVFLWMLCGVALYSLFGAWWPWERPFWDSTWTGGLLIAIIAAVIVEPAGRAMGVIWAYSPKDSN